MKNLLLILKLLLLFVNLVKSFEHVVVKYEKLDCTGKALIIQSSTQCSPSGNFNVIDDKNIQVSLNVKDFASCQNATVTYNDELGSCAYGYKSYLNKGSNVSLPEGYCAGIKILEGGDCSNALELMAYYNGVCDDDKYRYVCDGNKAKRFVCKHCMKELVDCVFDKELDSIEKCPSIKSKSLALITGDKSIQTPEPTKNPNDANTNGTTSGGNNGATSGGNNANGSNTGGGATTGGSNNGSHLTILNFNILFILLLSILLLLN